MQIHAITTPGQNGATAIGTHGIPSDPEARLANGIDVVPGLPAPENKKFYPALDGLRAVAVLMVFCQHYGPNRGGPLNWGWTGVDIFFVLSGFLITGILYDTREAAHRFRNFYARRTLRIFPLYYSVLLAALLATPWMHWVWHPAAALWLFYLGNYSRFIWLHDWLRASGLVDHLRSGRTSSEPFYLLINHFWSLCVEEQFYLLWPPVVFLVRDRVRLLRICLVCCGLCLAARIVAILCLPPVYIQAEILYRLTPFRVDALLLGGALALALRGPGAKKLESLAAPIFAAFLAGFVLFELVHHLFVGAFYRPVPGAPGLNTIGFTLIDAFAGVLILVLLNPRASLYPIFVWRPLRRLGQISYGFYVFHDLFHFLYRRLAVAAAPYLHLNPDAGTALIAFCATLLLSFLSFRYFESRFLRLKGRFAN